MIVDQLRSIRVGRNLSRRELAEMSGISRKHISQIEGHKVCPSAAILIRLASTLGTEVVIREILDDTSEQ